MTVGAALMTFQSVRQYGISLFASAGVAGIVAGLAARPVLEQSDGGRADRDDPADPAL